MSESATSSRPIGGAEEFDRRMRSIQPTPPALGEALAELARLVGDEDPFREAPATPTPQLRPSRDTHGLDADFAAFDADLRTGLDAGEASGAPDSPAVVHSPVDRPDRWQRATPRFSAAGSRDPRPIEPNPDLWARGADDGRDAEPVLTATRDAPPPGTGGPRRTLVVLAAVVALTGGGLAASFLAKPSSAGIAAATAAAPTIMAATGPSKVKPDTPVAGDDAPSQPSTLLDKNSNDGTTAAKVVNTVEQPVDLGQAIKPTPVDPASDTPPSAFPEPRKVKTVLVRPDGSIIAEAPASTSAQSVPETAASQQASLAFDPKTAMPIVARPPVQLPVVAATPDQVLPLVTTDEPSTKPATPPAKTTTRAKPMASTPADASVNAAARTPETPKVVKAKPPRAVPAKPKAADAAPTAPDATTVADATPPAADVTSALPPQGGRFAVQLGAAPSEAEGKQTASRLGQKFAGDLGGARLGVVKAEAGGKTVFRVRAGGLSQDQAKALCAKVQAGGGGCFVARN